MPSRSTWLGGSEKDFEMKNECYECKKRKVGCHSDCTEYKQYKKVQELANKKRIVENISTGYSVESRERMRKKGMFK